MKIAGIKQIDGVGDNQKPQFGFELSNMGFSPSPSRFDKKSRKSVALLQTKRKISTIESITQSQKKNHQLSINNSSLKNLSGSQNSFQSSQLSDDQFFDAQSNFGNQSDNMSQFSYNTKKNKNKISSQSNYESQESEKYNDNEERQNDFSSDSDESFYSMNEEDSSPDFQYDKTKQNFYNHLQISPKSYLTSPNLQKLPQINLPQKVTSLRSLDINFSDYVEKTSRTNRLASIESDQSKRRRRSSSADSDMNQFDIMQIVTMVAPQNNNCNLQEITEESLSEVQSSMQSRQLSRFNLNEGNQANVELKKYLNLSHQRSSCINSFQTKNLNYRNTTDTLNNSMRLDQSFLRDDDRVSSGLGFDVYPNPKYIGKEKIISPEKRSITSYLENRNTLQCMATIQTKLQEKEQKQNHHNQLNKSTNYYRQKKDIQTLFTFNRVLEIKRKYQSRQQEQKAFKNFTFNLTFILSCEILKCKQSLQLFQFLHLYSIILRMYFYCFSIFMICLDSKYNYYLLPMIFIPRFFYILSMFKVIFSYQNHTKSYRQVSQIFNSAFGSDDYFQIMNMNQLLTSDSFEKLSRGKILARFKFIFCPSELNIFSLKKDSVSLSKRKDVWYFSNYILISIEYMTVYIIMIFFTIYNSQFKKQFQIDKDFSLNIYTFSFIYFTISVILFIIFNLYYLRKGNIKLRKDNISYVTKTKKPFQ